MIKIKCTTLFKSIPKALCVLISFIILLAHPQEIGEGIKIGFALLAEKIIPALFPFMILASYVADSNLIRPLTRLFNTASLKLFRINGNGITVVLLGLLGGYPIGAKTLYRFYSESKLSNHEVARLFPWCVNPGPAFTITAVGTFMLKSTKAGIIMYASVILAAFSTGLISRFAKDSGTPVRFKKQASAGKSSFIDAVSCSTSAMLSICGWVLIFSAISNGLSVYIKNEAIIKFIGCISEVTTGCSILLRGSYPIPVVCAILSFGGLAVIFQIAPELNKCNYKLSHFICWRIFNGALSAFYCSVLLKLFPITSEVYQSIQVGSSEFNFSYDITAAVILLITCIVFILEVDYKKKVC